MSEREAWLQAHWFKSSHSLGKYEQGKWRSNTCFPQNHQDALEQSIYPQTAPLELLSCQCWKTGFTGSFHRGMYVCVCVYLSAKDKRCTAEKKKHWMIAPESVGWAFYFVYTRWAGARGLTEPLIYPTFWFHDEIFHFPRKCLWGSP